MLMRGNDPDDALKKEGPAPVEEPVLDSSATTLMIRHNKDLAVSLAIVEGPVEDDGRLAKVRGASIGSSILLRRIKAGQPRAVRSRSRRQLFFVSGSS